MTEEDDFSTDANLEPLQEDSGLGSIQINNNVVANIVAMACQEVPGVYGLASGDVLKGLFNKRVVSVTVDEDEEGRYLIKVKLILVFGVRLAKVAVEVQNAVRSQVENMTDKEVARVDVIVDAVRNPDSPDSEDED